MDGSHHIREFLPPSALVPAPFAEGGGDGIDYRVLTGGSSVEMRMRRTVTAAYLMEHVMRVAGDQRVRRSFSALWDGSEVTGFHLECSDIRRLAGVMLRAESKFIGSRLAIAAPNLLVFGMSRILQALTEAGPVVIEVLRDAETAREWLRRD